MSGLLGRFQNGIGCERVTILDNLNAVGKVGQRFELYAVGQEKVA